jgi:hypothetical protein
VIIVIVPTATITFITIGDCFGNWGRHNPDRIGTRFVMAVNHGHVFLRRVRGETKIPMNNFVSKVPSVACNPLTVTYLPSFQGFIVNLCQGFLLGIFV